MCVGIVILELAEVLEGFMGVFHSGLPSKNAIHILNRTLSLSTSVDAVP